MTFILICEDKKNSLDIRIKTRKQHLAYLSSFKKNIILAGPLEKKNLDPKGSIIILDFEEKKKVEEFLKNDPYTLANLFKKIKIIKFKRVL